MLISIPSIIELAASLNMKNVVDGGGRPTVINILSWQLYDRDIVSKEHVDMLFDILRVAFRR